MDHAQVVMLLVPPALHLALMDVSLAHITLCLSVEDAFALQQDTLWTHLQAKSIVTLVKLHVRLVLVLQLTAAQVARIKMHQ